MTIVLSERTHIARKQHHCGWCDEAIVPGDRYCAIAQIDWEYGDGFSTFKSHEECDRAIRESYRYVEYEAIDWGSSHDRGTPVTTSEWL